MSGGITGIQEENNPAQTRLFPNPFSIEAVFETVSPLKNAGLIITNSLGQKVKELTSIVGSKTIINREELPSGIYYIILTEESKVQSTYKVLISD